MPDLATAQWSFLIAVTLVAGLVQSATGFGFAVIAVPLFLLALDSLTAIQVNIALNLVNALVVAPRIWRAAPAGLLRRLAAGTLLGLPLGMLAFQTLSVAAVKLAVAVLVIGFAIHLLRARRRPAAAGPPGARATVAVGGVSGALASALAMPGPPVLIYLSHFDIDKQAFRATNLTLYVFAYALALALQASLGGMSAGTWALTGVLAPMVIAGSVLGHLLSPWLSERVFRACVLVTLLATGVYMLLSTLRALL